MAMPQTPESQTVAWKQAGNLALHADVYIPPDIKAGEKRPIAMMFHGGGHVMLSRKTINSRQIPILHAHGFLPVSFDFRLCPELNVLDGPMNDVCEALRWARSELPTFAPTLVPGLEADGEKVVAVGFSTGGHLSLTLGFTAAQRGLRPPEAIVAFYCPTDYHSEHWRTPFNCELSLSSPDEPYDVLEDFQKEPIANYFPTSPPGTLSLSDPRSRFILHTTWHAQHLPFLLRGPLYNPSDTDFPTDAEIDSISPYAQILNGRFCTPTFLVHGSADGLIPYQQSVRTVEALREKGIEADVEIVEGGQHLFDMAPRPGVVFEPSVARAYAWLHKVVSGV